MGDGDDARQRMQLKTFTTWVNLQLNKVGLEVENLKTDFADGIKLLKVSRAPRPSPNRRRSAPP